MAKLSTARDFCRYGPSTARNRWEYFNAGLYLFAAVLLVGGFAALNGAGLPLIPISLFLIAIANGHDLVAHLDGIDFSLSLLGLDPQLAWVELAVPFFVILGDGLTAIALVFLLIQKERGFNVRLENAAANLLISGPVFWLLGSVLNLCQVYERSNGRLQILQKCVQIPFLMGSLLLLVGGIFNSHEILGLNQTTSFHPVSKSWVWLSIFGSLFYLIGGLMNIVKVYNMQKMNEDRLEKLRGGALERLTRDRESRVPLILEGSGRRPHPSKEPFLDPSPAHVRVPVEGQNGRPATTTPYKDVLVSGGGGA